MENLSNNLKLGIIDEVFEPEIDLELKNKFFNAIEGGDLKLVKKLLEEEPELLDIHAPNDWTPIMFAVRYGWFDMMKYLIEQGCNLQNDRGHYEVLHTAGLGQNVKIMKYLIIELGCDLNGQRKEAPPYKLIPLNPFLGLYLTHGHLIYEIRLKKSTYKRLNRGYNVNYEDVQVEEISQNEENKDKSREDAKEEKKEEFVEIGINDPFEKYDRKKILKAYEFPDLDKKIVYDRNLAFLSAMIEWEKKGKGPSSKNLFRILAYI